MSERARKHFDIRIEMLTEKYLDEAASLHQICFPQKVETLLGKACVRDVFMERVLRPERDTLCLIAIHQPDDRVAGYLCVSGLVPGTRSPHAFINRRVLARHMVRSGWFRPGVWKWWGKRIRARFIKEDYNENSVVPIPPWGSVVMVVGLHPSFRGGNVGADLMMAIEDAARERGARRLYLLVERTNVRAERLYASVGWQRTSPDTDRWQIFSMQKDLVLNPEGAG